MTSEIWLEINRDIRDTTDMTRFILHDKNIENKQGKRGIFFPNTELEDWLGRRNASTFPGIPTSCTSTRKRLVSRELNASGKVDGA